jgi:hypothetical protein
VSDCHIVSSLPNRPCEKETKKRLGFEVIPNLCSTNVLPVVVCLYMKLEQQVVSLELAKKLKELGFKQDSTFYWSRIDGSYVQLLAERECQYELTENDGVERYSAFTATELGALLPDELWDEEDDGWDNLCTYPNGSHWCCAYRRYYGDDGTWSTTYVEKANTEAAARAKMLVYLIDSGLVDVSSKP